MTGTLGESQSSCGSPYLALNGTLHGSQLQMSTATASTGENQMTALMMPAQPMHLASSCGPTTLSLTYHAPSTLSGTIANCTTVNITFTKH